MYPIVESFVTVQFVHSAPEACLNSPPLIYAIIIQISTCVGCIGYAIYFVGMQSGVNCSSHVQRCVSK